MSDEPNRPVERSGEQPETVTLTQAEYRARSDLARRQNAARVVVTDEEGNPRLFIFQKSAALEP